MQTSYESMWMYYVRVQTMYVVHVNIRKIERISEILLENQCKRESAQYRECGIDGGGDGLNCRNADAVRSERPNAELLTYSSDPRRRASSSRHRVRLRRPNAREVRADDAQRREGCWVPDAAPSTGRSRSYRRRPLECSALLTTSPAPAMPLLLLRLHTSRKGRSCSGAARGPRARNTCAAGLRGGEMSTHFTELWIISFMKMKMKGSDIVRGARRSFYRIHAYFGN